MAVREFSPAVSIEEYLNSSYEPDCDYVDGQIEERNLGEYDHATIQTLLALWFGNRRQEWDIRVAVELRVQVSPTRFRVPDVCVMRRDLPVEQIIQHPPLICIEVLSPEDRVNRVRIKTADYFKMGVEHVWIIDPGLRDGLVCTPNGMDKPEGGRFSVSGTDIYLPLDAIFADLDDM